MNYESTRAIASSVSDGVVYRIRRMSFGRRMQFVAAVRELGRKLEFLVAGETLSDKLEAAEVTAAVHRVYLEWGLVSVEGLQIDGNPCDVATFIDSGPEDLCQEALDVIRQECELSEQERKN